MIDCICIAAPSMFYHDVIIILTHSDSRNREQICKWRRVEFALVAHGQSTFIGCIQKYPMQSMKELAFRCSKRKVRFLPAIINKKSDFVQREEKRAKKT